MPAITVRCSGCRKRLTAPEKAAGRTVRCPNCGTLVTLVADADATVIDASVPDFSYLKDQPAADDDILLAEGADDHESALGQSTVRRPAQPTKVAASPPPPPVVYTPPPVGVNGAGDNPFADLTDTAPTPQPPLRKQPPAPEPEPEPAPTAARTPGWVWPVVVLLAVYAAVATGAAVWGWVVPH